MWVVQFRLRLLLTDGGANIMSGARCGVEGWALDLKPDIGPK